MTALSEKIGMPLTDFLEAVHQQPFDFINGEKRWLMPTMFGHGELIRILFRLLDSYLGYGKEGEVFAEVTFILPGRADRDWVLGSRTPDVMVFVGGRLAEYRAAYPDYRQRPLALVPDLVIEIISPTDTVSDLDEKIDAYLVDGVRLIWAIDPQRRKAVVYAPERQPLHLSGEDGLDGEDVLPGFQVSLKSLFA